MKDAILNLIIGTIVIGVMFLLGKKASIVIGVCIFSLCVLYMVGWLVRFTFGILTGKDIDIE